MNAVAQFDKNGRLLTHNERLLFDKIDELTSELEFTKQELILARQDAEAARLREMDVTYNTERQAKEMFAETLEQISKATEAQLQTRDDEITKLRKIKLLYEECANPIRSPEGELITPFSESVALSVAKDPAHFVRTWAREEHVMIAGVAKLCLLIEKLVKEKNNHG